MTHLSNIKKSFALTAVLFLFTACGGGGGGDASSPVSSTNGDSLATSSETTTSTSAPETSTTSTLKVVPVQINESITTENSATIEWTPNGYTTKLVEYGTRKKYGSELLVTEDGTITLFNLQANTTYHYRIVSEDKNGRKVVSRDNTFMTLEQSTQSIVTEPIVTEPIPADTTPPVITVTGNNPETVIQDATYTDAGATATDDRDGTVTVTPTGSVDTSTVGTYTITYRATDIASNTATATRTVNVVFNPPEAQDPVCTSGPAMQQGQIKDSLSGTGLVDVTVTIAGCSTKTDADGFYTLQNIAMSEEAVVNFEKEGYLLGSTKIQIKELSGDNTPSTNYLEYSIYAHDYQYNHDTTKEISSPRIYVDTSVLQTNGNTYIGTMEVKLTILDNDENAFLNSFPGSFEGINTYGQVVPFVSYGLISFSFKDDNGNTLNLTSDTKATLTFITVPSSEEQNIIPLWYYDYDQGLWIEEGFAERNTDSTYSGDISHPGTWSLNKPIEEEPGIYRSRIVHTDGTPAQNIRIHAIGNNWSSSDLSTDEDGIFEIKVIPGKSFKLKAYNYKDKYEASNNGSIAAINSGEIAGN